MSKYEKALEQARNYYPDNLFLDSIFPELRESEDERIRKFLKDYAIEMIAGLESDISISVYDGVKGHDPDAEEELEKWRGARAWLERQKQQESAKWSEEDEYCRNQLIVFCENCMQQDSAAIRCASWLKSLRPQPHWKQSLATADLENDLCDIQDNYHDCSHEYKVLGEAIEFIRSTESHWKPSKEQMDVLKISAYGTYQNGDSPALRELYEQLQKL